jgi:hypothetical protein
MKKNRSIYKIALVSLLAFSCNKLIEIPDHPIDKISENRVFSDSADIMSAVVGVYSNFNAFSSSGSLGSGQVTAYCGQAADEILYAYNTTFTNNAYVATDGTVIGLWKSGYENIYQMNSCINNIPNTTVIGDSLKRALVGEMKFTRAFYYFQLVNLFGGVPLVTVNDYNITSKLPRATVDEVYDLIRSDLAAARAVLQPKYPSASGARIRANLYAAMALSAKVFLYRQQWDSAAMMASEIINSGSYQLQTDPGTVFLSSSQEIIWSLPANTLTNFDLQTGEGATFLPFSQYSTPSYTVNPILLNAFEEDDKRKASWIIPQTVGTNVYNVLGKYKNRVRNAATTEAYVMLRLADMYLVLAEAQAQSGNTADAITNLNKVRTRAGLPDYTGSDDDLLAAIYHERQVEMAFEWGNRWYDLKRTGTINTILGAEKPSWKPDAALFPIPADQIIANVYLKQNDGY